MEGRVRPSVLLASTQKDETLVVALQRRLSPTHGVACLLALSHLRWEDLRESRAQHPRSPATIDPRVPSRLAKPSSAMIAARSLDAGHLTHAVPFFGA